MMQFGNSEKALAVKAAFDLLVKAKVDFVFGCVTGPGEFVATGAGDAVSLIGMVHSLQDSIHEQAKEQLRKNRVLYAKDLP